MTIRFLFPSWFPYTVPKTSPNYVRVQLLSTVFSLQIMIRCLILQLPKAPAFTTTRGRKAKVNNYSTYHKCLSIKSNLQREQQQHQWS